MIRTRGRHVAFRLSNPAWAESGKVVAIGGESRAVEFLAAKSQAQDSVEIYDPTPTQGSSAPSGP